MRKKKKIVSLTGVKAENTNKKCIDEFDMLCIDLKNCYQFYNFIFYILVVLKFCSINLLHLKNQIFIHCGRGVAFPSQLPEIRHHRGVVVKNFASSGCGLGFDPQSGRSWRQIPVLQNINVSHLKKN